MVTTRSKSGSLPAPAVRQEDPAPKKRPFKCIGPPTWTPEQIAAAKANEEKERVKQRAKGLEIAADIAVNPRSQTAREIPAHVEAVETQLRESGIDDFEIVGDAYKGLNQREFASHIEHYLGLQVKTWPIPKPNCGSHLQKGPETIGNTERVTAFVKLKNGEQGHQFQETDIQDYDEDPIGHAVVITVAPTLNELLTGTRYVGRIQREWLDMTEPAKKE